MVSIHALWLPILLSAATVFIASSIVHMFLKYHASDHSKMPDEAGVLEALRKFNIPAGDYILPRPADMKDMKSKEFDDKVAKGPNVVMTIWGGGPAGMGKQMALWFLYSVVIGIFAAYVAGRALGVGAPYLAVFRFVGVTAFVSYSLGQWQDSIWYRRKWSTTIKNTFDGLLYACLTAGIFGWLWPR